MTDQPPADAAPAEEQEPQDLKSQFRAALERKQAQARSGQEHVTGGAKAQSAHGRAGGKRQFRRKSG
ncbi:DUF5302 domain-containing protein [Actinokineospora bangkokensis]|uniref:DUF5302 domain-containing protein n=1 Tax=Actinokineospora bangkokensis TaxID=1193682 RepID=A0A1Q9LH65_9PSEU|nr:DUF5302 domain-containing protein [Actinokineospora bangkokensis]OLR91355.1 hypothetical protein BJP25_27230 [Actinokineospora bangkokensis]